MEEIRGEGGKHVMKCGPESLSNWTGAMVTAAGLSGGAPAPPEVIIFQSEKEASVCHSLHMCPCHDQVSIR